MSAIGPLVFLALLHLVGLTLGAGLLLLVLRGDRGLGDDDGGGGWGGGRGPDAPPLGGPPLPDARPARRRLREPGRLADLLPRPARRAVREPARPAQPSRSSSASTTALLCSRSRAA